MESFRVFSRADLSHNSFYPWRSVYKYYNTILIPKNLNVLVKIGDTISIKHNNKILYQTAVLNINSITMVGIEYFYVHIAPGLPNDVSSDLHIIFDNNEHQLYTRIDDKLTCKLILGLLVLNNNYYHSFNSNDNIQIAINNKVSTIKIGSKINKYNFYKPSIFVTILELLTNENNLDIIYDLNSTAGKFYPVYIRSLDTKIINEKGSIVIQSQKQNNRTVNCSGPNNYNRTFSIKSRLEIKNLSKGNYDITILDPDKNVVYNEQILVDSFSESSPITKHTLPLFVKLS